MLTRAQSDAIREHVALDEPVLRLIRLANTDFYEGPAHVEDDDDPDRYPGFSAACEMIRAALPCSDLYIDLLVDEVIGEDVPHDHDVQCDCAHEHVLHVGAMDVVRVLVGRKLAGYV